MKGKIFLSIVIPCFNAKKTIVPLLSSLSKSRGIEFNEIEVLIVDDHSSDGTLSVLMQYFNREGFPTRIRLLLLSKNGGPAKARNIGVKYAEGQVILFLDADIELKNKTLYEVIKSFREDADLYALTGVWEKNQRNHAFFPKFKALRDWSYWINERDPKNYYYLFSTRIAAIRRDLFLRLGGFDETYKAALVEDIDLTYKIARRYAVVFNPKAAVHHEFESFTPIAKKYFWRSFYWSRMYRERKKFDPVATTGKEAMTAVSAGLIVGGLLISILSYLGNLGISRWLTIATGIFIVIHLFGVRKFLWFCVREEGLWFGVKAFFTGIVLYLVILAGAAVSIIPSKLYRNAMILRTA